MEFVIKISQFLLSLSLLIVLHEFGHFLPAKWFKTKVEKFYLFFDVKFSLFKKKIGETVYGIGWLPLGGYVKIAGMIDESMDTEQMKQEPQPWEFRSKPAWQRLIIMLGGVFVNFLLAYVIYVAVSFIYGDADIKMSSIKDGFRIENPLLQDMGFKTGDNIVAIDDMPLELESDLRTNLISASTVTIERQGQQQVITLPEDFLGQLSTSKDRSLFEMRHPFIVAAIPETSINKDAGLQKLDVITAVNGEKLMYFDQFKPLLQTLKGQDVTVDVIRDGKALTKQLKVSDDGLFNLVAADAPQLSDQLGAYKITRKSYGFFESFAVGGQKFVKQVGSYWAQLKLIFNPSTGAYKGVGGFKAIYDIFPDQWNWLNFWLLTAFLSIMLGVVNLLPIPALDGGHVMFLLYEMISGRKPNDKFMEYAQMVGFFILIALVLFANGNDIFKAIFN